MKNFAGHTEKPKLGNVSWNTPTPIPNFTRAYIRGFGVGVGGSQLTLTGQTLEGYYLFPDYFFSLKVSDDFYPASSNVYSLDYVFDLADSWFYAFGVPSPAVIYLGLVSDPNDFSYRVNVLNNVGFDPNWVVNLPTLSGYWRPNYA